MKNKKLAIFLIILCFFAVFVVLSSTIFSLKSVEVKFFSTTNNLSEQQQEIIDSAGFRYGESVFLSPKSKYVKNIEKNKPYIKVLNIETVFPSKYVINAVERNECFAIKLSNNKYAIVDEEMKVLKIQDRFQNSTENAIEILNSNLAEQNVDAGDFFDCDAKYYKTLFNGFREWKLSYVDVKARITSIQIDYEREGQLLINMRSGVQIIVKNSTYNLSNKLNWAFSFYDTKVDDNGVEVDYTKDGIIYVTDGNQKVYYVKNVE